MDYYMTLGLTPDSSAEEIKKVYRKLAMQYHPDRNGGNPESEERLKEINQAYQILGDEEREGAMTSNTGSISETMYFMKEVWTTIS